MSRRGTTLVECLVTLVISALLIAAVYAVLLAGRRYAGAASAGRALRQNLRAASAVLRGELEALSGAAGDLIAITDSAVTIRAQRAFGIACAKRPPATIVLDDSLVGRLRQIDPARDHARIFAAGDPLTIADDQWIGAAIAAVGAGTCPNGHDGTALTLGAPPASFAAIAPGSPVRVYEVAEYRSYRDASGAWWLGVRTAGPAGWSATSPIAGPLRGPRGLVFRYFGQDLAPAGVPDSVGLVEAELHAIDVRPFAMPGRYTAPLEDSLTMRVAVREPE